MIPVLTTMPAATVTAATPAAIETAVPGFAALLASAAPMVTAQPAPTPSAAAPIMAATLAVGVAAGIAASASVSAPISVARSSLPAPVTRTGGDVDAPMPSPSGFSRTSPEPGPQPNPGAPSRVASIPIAVAPSRLENSQLSMSRVSLAEHSPIALAVQRVPLASTPAAPGPVASRQDAVSVRGEDMQLSGGGVDVSTAEPMPHPDANVAVSRVPSSQTAKPLRVTATVADSVSVPEADHDRARAVTDDSSFAASAVEALPRQPSTADAPSLSPTRSFAEAAISAPMVPQALAVSAVSLPPTSALAHAEPVAAVPSALARQRPDTVAPVVRGSLPVSALSLPATAPATAVVPGIEPKTAQAAQVALRAMAAAPATLAATSTSAAIMSPPSALVLSSAPAVAAADPSSPSFVPATAPATALSPAMALASPQPAPTTLPAAITALRQEAGPQLRTGNAFAAPRLPRDVEDRETVPGLLAIAEPAPLRTPLRAEATVAAAWPIMAAVENSIAPAVDLAIESGRLGAVRIGIEGGAGDLKVSFGLSPAAAALVSADAPRLIADLAAGGVRLQSLDVSGGGTGGQPPRSQHAPSPRSAASPATINAPTVRPGTADRYA